MDRSALEADVTDRRTRWRLNSPQLRLPSGCFQHRRTGALDPDEISTALISPPGNCRSDGAGQPSTSTAVSETPGQAVPKCVFLPSMSNSPRAPIFDCPYQANSVAEQLRHPTSQSPGSVGGWQNSRKRVNPQLARTLIFRLSSDMISRDLFSLCESKARYRPG